MTKLIDMTLTGFLDELASESPAPGGGSVAALSGALGAALTAMVCHLTEHKPGYEPVQAELPLLVEHAERLRTELTKLIDEDAIAYTTVVNALKLPKTTDEEKGRRRDTLQKAFIAAANIPLQTARLCGDLLQLAADVAHKGNKNSITDAAVAALMAQAASEAAILNVSINLTSIKDTDYVTQTSMEIIDLQQKAKTQAKAIYEYVTSTL